MERTGAGGKPLQRMVRDARHIQAPKGSDFPPEPHTDWALAKYLWSEQNQIVGKENDSSWAWAPELKFILCRNRSVQAWGFQMA